MTTQVYGEDITMFRKTYISVLFAAILFLGAPCYGILSVGSETILKTGTGNEIKRGEAAVAYGSNTFLVAWREGWHGLGGSSRINVARVNMNGTVLDNPIEIATSATGVQTHPRVAFYNGVFLVVWQDFRNGKDYNILGARINTSGTVLDSPPISIATAAGTEAMPDVAPSDNGWMVVYHAFPEGDNKADVYARPIASNGTPGTAVSVANGGYPRIAWNGTEYLLSYVGYWGRSNGVIPTIEIIKINTSGTPTSSMVRVSTWGTQHFDISASPDGGWSMLRDGGFPDFWQKTAASAFKITSITSAGILNGSEPSQTASPSPLTIPTNWVDCMYNSGQHSADWSGTSANIRDIYPYGEPAVIKDGDYNVVAWTRYYAGGETGADFYKSNIQIGRIDGWEPLSTDIDPYDDGGVYVTQSEAFEIEPDLAGNNSGSMLVVYEKVTDGESEIGFKMVSTSVVSR